MNTLLDKKEVAALLTVSTSTVDRLRKLDGFPKPSMSFDYGNDSQPILRWNSDDIAAYAGINPRQDRSPDEITTICQQILDSLSAIADTLAERKTTRVMFNQDSPTPVGTVRNQTWYNPASKSYFTWDGSSWVPLHGFLTSMGKKS